MLEYELIKNSSEYRVINETDKSVDIIQIPDLHGGLPVTEVTAMFTDYNNLKEIYFGNNVRTTGFATLDSPSIEKIYFGKSICGVKGPFFMLEKLNDIYYCGTEEDWQKIVFMTVDETDTLLPIENAKKHYGILGNTGFLKNSEDVLLPFTHWDCVKGKPETTPAAKVTYDNSTSGLKANNVKEAIDELNAKHFDATAIESWSELQYLVRSGRAKDFLNIGDKFVCRKSGKELEWDVIGIDEDVPSDPNFTHSLTLQLSGCYANMPFSKYEASYFAYAALSPGNYYIGLKHYTKPTTYYAFTLTETLPMDHMFRVSDNLIYFYSSREDEPYKTINVDLVSDNKSDMMGTELKSSAYYLNSTMGTVNYEESDIRLWLNSSEENWRKNLNLYSIYYKPGNSEPGFAYGLDEDFFNAVSSVKKEILLPDGEKVELNDKFFLLSLEEVYGKEGRAYSFYKNNSSLLFPCAEADSVRVKCVLDNPRPWWLRDAAQNDEGLLRVYSDGAITAVKTLSVLTYGTAPACCIC